MNILPYQTFVNNFQSLSTRTDINKILQRYEAIRVSEERVDEEDSHYSFFSGFFAFKSFSQETDFSLKQHKFQPNVHSMSWTQRLKGLEFDINSSLRQIKQLSEQVDRASDLKEKQILIEKLLKVQESFGILCQELVSYKCDVLAQMDIALRDLNVERSLLGEIDILKRCVSKQLGLVEEQVSFIHHQLQIVQSSLKPPSRFTIDLSVKNYVNANSFKNFDLLIHQFKGMTGKQINPPRLKELYQKFEERLTCIEKALKEINLNSITKNEKKELLILHREVLLLAAEITAAHCTSIRQMNQAFIKQRLNNPELADVMNRHFQQAIQQSNDILHALKQNEKHLKKFGGTMPNLNKEYVMYARGFFAIKQNTIEVKAHEPWHLSPWGQLIVDSNNFLSRISDSLGLGFQDKINELMLAEKDLQETIENKGNENIQELEKLHDIQRELYPMLLIRIIHIIGEKQRLLKKEETHLTPANRAIIETDIQSLNTAYQSMLEKYKQLPVKERSFQDALVLEAKELAASLLNFGSKTGKPMSALDIQRQKYYADRGYSMLENVKEWLETLKVPEDKDCRTVLKEEVAKFLEWADKHPETAANLAGDIALSCAIIGGDSYVQWFRQMMTAKAYAHAFLTALREDPRMEPVDKDEELKFRALADLSSYAPVTLAVGQGLYETIMDGKFGLLDLLFKPGAKALKAASIQKAGRLIPNEQAKLAKAAVEIIQGEDFQEILNNQLKVQLFAQAGIVKDLIRRPGQFWNEVMRQTTIGWKTICKSTGDEKVLRLFAQILIPLFATAATVGLSAAALLGIASLPMATAIMFGLLILNTSNGMSRYLVQELNELYPTYDKVVNSLNKKEMAAKRKHFEDLILKDLEAMQTIRHLCREFIKEVHQRKGFALLASSKAIELSEDKISRQDLSSLEEILISHLDNKLLTLQQEKTYLIPEQYIRLFNQVAESEEFRKIVLEKLGIEKKPENKDFLNQVLAKIGENVIIKWLTPKLEKSFISNFLDIAPLFDTDKDLLNQVAHSARNKLNEKLAEKRFDQEEINQFFTGLDELARKALMNPSLGKEAYPRVLVNLGND